MKSKALLFWTETQEDLRTRFVLPPGISVTSIRDRNLLCANTEKPACDVIFLLSSHGCNWTAIDLLIELRRLRPQIPIVLVTAEYTNEWLVSALRGGSSDAYLSSFLAP